MKNYTILALIGIMIALANAQPQNQRPQVLDSANTSLQSDLQMHIPEVLARLIGIYVVGTAGAIATYKMSPNK